jgi:hypothetical protein
MAGMDAGAVSSAAGAAGASSAAATGASVLLAGTVVLGVFAAIKLIWDILDITLGPSFARLLPAVYTIAINIEHLETLGSLAVYDENTQENEDLLLEVQSALRASECEVSTIPASRHFDRETPVEGEAINVGPGCPGPPISELHVAGELSSDTPATATHDGGAEDKDLCKICLDSEANMLMLPCRHLCACSDCAAALTACPICRTAIAERMRIYR